MSPEGPWTYFPISEKEMMQEAREQGMPESAIQYILQLFALVRKGVMAEMTRYGPQSDGRGPHLVQRVRPEERGFLESAQGRLIGHNRSLGLSEISRSPFSKEKAIGGLERQVSAMKKIQGLSHERVEMI